MAQEALNRGADQGRRCRRGCRNKLSGYLADARCPVGGRRGRSEHRSNLRGIWSERKRVSVPVEAERRECADFVVVAVSGEEPAEGGGFCRRSRYMRNVEGFSETTSACAGLTRNWS